MNADEAMALPVRDILVGGAIDSLKEADTLSKLVEEAVALAELLTALASLPPEIAVRSCMWGRPCIIVT